MGSALYNSDTDSSFVDQSSFLASTEDSSHSYDLLRVDDTEVSEVVEDAALELLTVRRQEVFVAGLRSSGVYDATDLGEFPGLQEASGLPDASGVQAASDLQNFPDLQDASDLDVNHAANDMHTSIIEVSGLMTPPLASPDRATTLGMSDKRRGKMPVDGARDPASYAAPQDRAQSFDVWDCDDPTVPDLSPNSTLKAIKRFLGADQCAVVSHSAALILTSLTRN